MLVSYDYDFKNLTVSYVNERGDIEIEKKSLLKEDIFNWKISTKNRKDIDPSIRNYLGEKVYKDFSDQKLTANRLQELLLKYYPPKIFEYNEPKKIFCDIETEILDEFPDAKEAKSRVLTITLVNDKDSIITFSIKPLSEKQIKDIKKETQEYFSQFNKTLEYSFKYFKDEYDMLYSFFKNVKNMTLITGWNFVDYDWEFLVNRAKRLGMNPYDFFPEKSKYFDNLPKHIMVVDYLELIKSFGRHTYKNYSLDNVSDELLGIKKVKYQGSLTNLYETDFQKYVFYNVVDTYLVKLIHEETNVLSVLMSLIVMTKTSFYKGFGKVALIENILIEKFLEQNKVIVKTDNSKVKSKIPGGWVKESPASFYKDISVFDYSSLYPSIMRQFNISPETYIGHKDLLDPQIVNDNICLESKGVFKKEIGVLPKLIEEIYTQRKEFQSISLKAEKEIIEIEKILKERETI